MYFLPIFIKSPISIFRHLYPNSPPSRVTIRLSFEYWTPLLSGIQVFGIQTVTVISSNFYLKFNFHFQALVDSFVEFDKTLVERQVVNELKKIAGTECDEEEEHDPGTVKPRTTAQFVFF